VETITTARKASSNRFLCLDFGDVIATLISPTLSGCSTGMYSGSFVALGLGSRAAGLLVLCVLVPCCLGLIGKDGFLVCHKARREPTGWCGVTNQGGVFSPPGRLGRDRHSELGQVFNRVLAQIVGF
jgi:hypothetical protein